jgi:hypothetical protein
MKVLKGVLIVVAAAFVILQFFRPPRNVADQPSTGDISTVFPLPAGLQEVLAGSCYDCHSNSTRYPWYAEIQPVGWWLNGHIRDGKRQLNFSEFATYRLRRQYHKLEEIADEVGSGAMPLPSYLIAHSDARLTEEQKALFASFVRDARASMESRYPADSLKGRSR